MLKIDFTLSAKLVQLCVEQVCIAQKKFKSRLMKFAIKLAWTDACAMLLCYEHLLCYEQRFQEVINSVFDLCC